MKTIKTAIITALCIAVAEGGIYGIHLYRRHQQQVIRELEVRYMYHDQDYAIPTFGAGDYYEYFDYSVVDERELYYKLITYNSEEGTDLTTDDVKEYLSSPYNNDGTLRVEYGWEGLHQYIEICPYISDGVKSYKSELEYILRDYRKSNGIENGYMYLDALSYEQIGELIRKNAEPEYEIDDEIMISELYYEDFEVMYKNHVINKDTTAEELFEILGIGKGLREKNCIATTEKYDYWEFIANGDSTESSMRFVFRTGKADGKTYPAAVWLDRIPTKRGVQTGDSIDKMWDAYGMPYDMNYYYYGSEEFQKRNANVISADTNYDTYVIPNPKQNYDVHNDYNEYYYKKEDSIISFTADRVTNTIKYICIEFADEE